MSKPPVTVIVAKLAQPHAAALGLEVVDVQFVREGGQRVLRLLIDREGGIALDDCEALSTVLGEELERADPIPYSYCLEVSSPGIERPLKKEQDFRRFAGHTISLRLYSPMHSRRNFSGVLLGLEGQEILLKAGDGGVVRLPLGSVASARLVYDEGNRKGGKSR